MNKYILITKEFLDTLFSEESLPENLEITFRVDSNLLLKVPSTNVSLIQDEDEDIYLSILSTNGVEYQLPEEIFTDYSLFSVISLDTVNSEEEEEEEEEESNLEDLVEIATIKVNEFNSLSVELSNLKKSGVPDSDEEVETIKASLSILDRELKTLSILIKAEKRFLEYVEQGKMEKAERIDNQIEQILDTYLEKYGTEAYTSLLLIELDSEDTRGKKEDDYDEEESLDNTFNKNLAKQLLSDLIESVQHSETIEKYASKASTLLKSIWVSDKNVQDAVTLAKNKAKEIKKNLLDELLK